jgi:hypothetical protein
MFKMDVIPIHGDGLEVRELGDDIIIISEDGKVMHTLTDTGKFIWETIDGKKTVKSILEIISNEYDVKRDQAEPDLIKFIITLIDKKLISIGVN